MKKLILFILFIFVVLFNIFNFKDETQIYDDIEINEEIKVLEYKDENEYLKTSDENEKIEKKDINIVSYIYLIEIGLTDKKANDFIEYRNFVGTVRNFDELKKIPNFTKKYIEILKEKTEIKLDNLLLNKYDINELNERQLKFLGISKKEIDKFLEYRKDNKIYDKKDLEKIFKEKTLKNIDEFIQF